MRKLLIALFLALSFTGVASADTSADKKKDPPKAKTGSPCKADADCDQSGRPQRCRDSKCDLVPTHPVT